MGAAFNAFRLRPGVIKMETCDKIQDEDGVEKNVKVPEDDQVIDEIHVPKNAKASAGNAIPKNPNVQDKIEVTMNDVATHPLTLTRRSRSPRPTSMEKYLVVNKLKVSLVGSMVRNDEDWRTFQALGLCGALLLLRGRVKSGLLLLIAVALASKKNPEWDRKKNQKLKANKNKVRWMEQEPLANKTSKDSKKTQKKEWSNPKEGHPKGIKTKVTQLNVPGWEE